MGKRRFTGSVPLDIAGTENLLGFLLMELREGNGIPVLSRPLPLSMMVFGDLPGQLAHAAAMVRC